MSRRFILVSLLILSLTACGATATSVPSPTLIPATKPPATAQPDQVLAMYHVSGGFAGLNDTLKVYGDGRLELTKSRPATTLKGQATPEQLQELQRILADPKFAELQDQYGQDQCCDRFAYTIEAGGKKIATFDGFESPELLADLQLILDEMRAGIQE